MTAYLQGLLVCICHNRLKNQFNEQVSDLTKILKPIFNICIFISAPVFDAGQCKQVTRRTGVRYTENNMFLAQVVLTGQVENVKNELTKIDDNKLQGSIIRSRIKWIEEGEKSSKFFFRLEKQNYVKKHIRKLQTDSGQIITDPERIATYRRSVYSKLLGAKEINIDLNEETYFLNNKTIPKLSESQRQLCEGQVTVEECTNILNTFKENKSPGNDGLTIEFYKFFWDKINTSLLNSFNEVFKKGNLVVVKDKQL